MEAYTHPEPRRLDTDRKVVELPVLLTIPDIARHLGVKERHVRRLIAERRIPFVKWGHLIRFEPGAIADWIGQHLRDAEEA
jgi:excisionase family DNA binding protein